MESVQWYLRRLRVMSLKELAHRSTEPARLGLLKLEGRVKGRAPAGSEWRRFNFCTAREAQLPAPACDFAPDAAERARLLQGEFGALGFPWRWRPEGGSWHTAPDTLRHWPESFFASIPYRAGNPFGDVRVVWEPARLQGLVVLALLARADPASRERATHLTEQILASWVRENRYLHGPHYLSAMECALRLIAVCHAADLLREQPLQPMTWACISGLVTSHAALIVRRLSLHSSSGNHLIAECAGLAYAGVLFSEHPRASQWLSCALRILGQEAPRQVLGDGGGIEQATHYHLFVVDLLGLVQRLLESRSVACPATIDAAVTRGRAFLGALAQTPEGLPSIGDADDGAALTRYLRISFEPPHGSATPFSTFPDTGYTRCAPQGQARLEVLIDHGPLGMAPSYGHGHADALSVLAAVRGDRLLVDPGTYGYNLGAKWRQYLRGTAAHNTVVVDGLDQAVQSGTFLWTQPYLARCLTFELAEDDGCLLLMRHDGYRRVGVVHWRGVLVSRDGALVVWDHLTGSGAHELEVNWHLGLEPVRVGSGMQRLVFGNGYCLDVSGGQSSLHRGESDPPRGWRSPRYGVRTPATNLRTVWRGEVPHEFTTVLGPEGSAIDVAAGIARLRRLLACCESA